MKVSSPSSRFSVLTVLRCVGGLALLASPDVDSAAISGSLLKLALAFSKSKRSPSLASIIRGFAIFSPGARACVLAVLFFAVGALSAGFFQVSLPLCEPPRRFTLAENGSCKV